MKQVEQGNYEIEISSGSTDEVGQLITSFKKMVSTLNNLINEVLLAVGLPHPQPASAVARGECHRPWLGSPRTP